MRQTHLHEHAGGFRGADLHVEKHTRKRSGDRGHDGLEEHGVVAMSFNRGARFHARGLRCLVALSTLACWMATATGPESVPDVAALSDGGGAGAADAPPQSPAVRLGHQAQCLVAQAAVLHAAGRAASSCAAWTTNPGDACNAAGVVASLGRAERCCHAACGAARDVALGASDCADATCEAALAPAGDEYTALVASLRACAGAGAGEADRAACRDVPDRAMDLHHHWLDVGAYTMQRAAVGADQWPAPVFARRGGPGGTVEGGGASGEADPAAGSAAVGAHDASAAFMRDAEL